MKLINLTSPHGWTRGFESSKGVEMIPGNLISRWGAALLCRLDLPKGKRALGVSLWGFYRSKYVKLWNF